MVMNLQDEEMDKPRGGLLGLFDKAMKSDDDTGLSPLQNFAAALDPLILKDLRGGEGIRRQGAQRAASMSKNKTVDMLRKQGRNDLANAVMNGTIGAKEAFSVMQSEKAADTAFGREKDLIQFKSGLDSSPNVQSSKLLPDDSGVVMTMRNGDVVVKTVGGETLTGQAALDFSNSAHRIYTSRQESIYGARRTGTNVADIETGGQASSVVAEGTAAGKETGRVKANLGEMQRNIPGLRLVVDQLSALSDEATYTALGQAANKVRKELGLETGVGAVARAEYIAVVDNQVLPLLRQTFGAQFTVAEGESLRATLGDPNKSPAEKKAVLNAFISQKERDLVATTQSVSSQSTVPIVQNNDPLGLRN